ncbi:hypothetical protein J28TS4_31730 [Paenibacillus lautus]|nr:hypothetical protein J28TS4_31730 [Paenibacillus lautus]
MDAQEPSVTHFGNGDFRFSDKTYRGGSAVIFSALSLFLFRDSRGVVYCRSPTLMVGGLFFEPILLPVYIPFK